MKVAGAPTTKERVDAVSSQGGYSSYDHFLSTVTAFRELWFSGPPRGKEERIARKKGYLRQLIAQAGATSEPVDYFEFGIYRGRSFRLIAEEMPGDEHRFFGFDTLRGLPEFWTGAIRHSPESPQRHGPSIMPRGGYSAEGGLPRELNGFEDDRALLVAGLFQDTLPSFLSVFSRDDSRRMILNVDCDLYSGTLFILTSMHGLVREGDLIGIDDIYDEEGEFRALNDYIRSYYLMDALQCVYFDGKAAIFQIIKNPHRHQIRLG